LGGREAQWTLEDLEAVVKKAVREAVEQARSEEMKLVVDALNKLATYTFEGFKKILEVLEEHSKILREHSKILEELEKRLGKLEASVSGLETTTARLEVTVGRFTSRTGIDMERMILNIYRDVLEQEGVGVWKVEKLRLKDVDGRYLRRGARLEIDIYAHDDKVYFIEVKSLVEVNDVEWFNLRCDIFEKILGRRPDRRIIVCINIFRDALERAQELGMHVIYGRVLEVEGEEGEVRVLS
jgi:hypothetical protein